MRTRNLKIFLLLTAAITLTATACKKHPQPVDFGLELNADYPDFRLKDETGQYVTPDDLKGEKTIMLFTVNTCGVCETLIEEMQGMKAAELEARLVVVHQSTGAVENDSLKQAKGWDFPVLTGDVRTFRKFKIKYTPFLYKFSAEGKVIHKRPLDEKADLIAFDKAN